MGLVEDEAYATDTIAPFYDDGSGDTFGAGAPAEAQARAAEMVRQAQLPTQMNESLEFAINKQKSILADLEKQRTNVEANALDQRRILAGQENAVAPIRQGAVTALGDRTKAAENLAAQPIPALAEPPKLANFLNRDVATTMASVATLIAGFNSNGRIRGIRANQSLAAGLDGFMNGNMTVAKLGLEDWKNQVEHQLTEFKLIRQQNLDILNAKGMTIEQKMAEIQLAQAPYQNQMMQSLLEKKGIDGVVQIDKEMAHIIQAIEGTLIKSDPAMQALNLQYRQSQIDYNKARTANVGAQGANMDSIFGIPMADIPVAQPGQKNEEFLGMLPAARADIIRKIAKGDLDVKTLGGMGKDASAMRRNYNEAAALYDPRYRQQMYGVIDKALREGTPGGKIGNNVLAVNTLPHHLDDYVTAFSNLNNTQQRTWNSIKNKFAQEFGDPALDQLKVSLGFIAGETAKIVKGGNASPGEKEIEYWQNVYSSNASPDAARRTVWQNIQGLGGRLSEVESAMRDATQDPNYRALKDEAYQLILKNKPQGVPMPEWLQKRQAREQSAPQQTGQPGGQIIKGQILVKDRATGELKLMSERSYNAYTHKYERLPDGAPIQAPQISDGAY